MWDKSLDLQDVLEPIVQALRERGMTARQASMEAVGSPEMIRDMRRGRVPSVNRVRALCEVLGLEFYVGPQRRAPPPTTTTASPPSWVDHLRADLQEALRHLPEDAANASNDYVMVPLARDVRAAAGTAKLVFNEVPEFRVAIHRSVLPAWVRPDSLICIRAVGDSMEPTVHDGDLIALDHSKVEPIDRQMFVVSLGDDGLVVKRLRLRGERVWELVSDNETYDSRAVSEDDRVIGRVVWSGPPRDAPET